VQPANILLKSNDAGSLVPLITDFGIAKKLPSRSTSVAAFKPVNLVAGSMAYAPPEIIRSFDGTEAHIAYLHQENVLSKVDIYSFAMVLVEVLTGKLPWFEEQPEDIALKVADNARPKLPEPQNERVGRIVVIIKKCWREDPLYRPSAKQLLSSWGE
jgi:serine/threonine protein kinase